MADDSRSIPELISTALGQVSRLVRDEIQLARAEISRNISHAAMGIPMLAASAVIMVAVVVVLLIAAATWLTQLGWSAPVAYLIAAGAGAIVSGLCAWVG